MQKEENGRMKVVFEAEKINMALLMLDKIRVQGVEQSKLIVAIYNTLSSGEELEMQDGDTKEGGKKDGSR